VVSCVLVVIVVLLSPVTLPVVLGIEIVDVDLIVVIWDHGLLPEQWRSNIGLSRSIINLHWRQSKSFSNFGVQHRREDHIKLEDHPPLLERVPVLWHALALDLLQVASLDDLSWERVSISIQETGWTSVTHL